MSDQRRKLTAKERALLLPLLRRREDASARLDALRREIGALDEGVTLAVRLLTDAKGPVNLVGEGGELYVVTPNAKDAS